jgi:lipopolysaccharide export system ATP-binding protein
VHETFAITERAYLMFEGKILKEGSADALADDEEARRLYLGSQFKMDRYG